MISAADIGFELTAAQFDAIASMLHRHAGIRMRRGKEGLVRARLSRRLRVVGASDFADYIHLVESSAGRDEFREMVDALTTNKTSFFRERAHFDYLRRELLPRLSGPIRCWCAGCSTGQEPYTLAMTLAGAPPISADSPPTPLDPTIARDLAPAPTVRILATDINSRVLAAARDAFYAADEMSDVPDAMRRRFWRPAIRDGRETYTPAPDLRSLVQFARLNLMEPWPMRGPFDVIMCRNVMIYFDKATQQRLVERFWAVLRPGGHLFVGHSESLTGFTHRFRYVQPAVYVK